MKLEIRKFGDRVRDRQHIGEGSLVQQNLQAETDINRIMAKYAKTGQLTHINTAAQAYGDFSDVPDYKSGLERLQAAQDTFMSLPAKLRDHFHNDPGRFIEFASNPENIEEMRTLGLAPKLPPAAERPSLEAKGGNPEPKAQEKPNPKGDQ